MIDATLGLGGHTEAVLERCPQAHVIGIDRDVHALDRSRERLAPYGERVTFVHAVYDEIADVLDELGHPYVDGVLFDLGVSSMQLDLRERGFAYSQDAPLDMRMDDTGGPTAADVLNEYPVEELDPDPQALRRGAVRPPDRRGRGPRARQGALHHLGAARRAALRLDPRPRAAHRGTPREAHVPGAADRGQRRARRAAPGDPGRGRRDRRRRARGGHELPLARGPDHQARLRAGDAQRPAPGPAVRARGARAGAAAGDAGVGSEKASPAEIEANPRAASVRLRAVERVHAGAVA